MTIRLILILTVFALVLGGVGAAFVQAQTTTPAPATAPDPAQNPDPAQKPEPTKKPETTKASVKSDARHDDVQSELAAVEVKADDCDARWRRQCSDNCHRQCAQHAEQAERAQRAQCAERAQRAECTQRAQRCQHQQLGRRANRPNGPILGATPREGRHSAPFSRLQRLQGSRRGDAAPAEA